MVQTKAATKRAIVLDTAALIAGTDSLFALGGLIDPENQQHVEAPEPHDRVTFYTTPDVVREVRDKRARARLTLLRDMIVVRPPSSESLASTISFAKATGDFSVLSLTDLRVIALCRMLEIERDGGSCLRGEPEQQSFSQIRIGKPISFAEIEKMEREAELEEMERQKLHEENGGWTTVKHTSSHRRHNGALNAKMQHNTKQTVAVSETTSKDVLKLDDIHANVSEEKRENVPNSTETTVLPKQVIHVESSEDKSEDIQIHVDDETYENALNYTETTVLPKEGIRIETKSSDRNEAETPKRAKRPRPRRKSSKKNSLKVEQTNADEVTTESRGVNEGQVSVQNEAKKPKPGKRRSRKSSKKKSVNVEQTNDEKSMEAFKAADECEVPKPEQPSIIESTSSLSIGDNETKSTSESEAKLEYPDLNNITFDDEKDDEDGWINLDNLEENLAHDAKVVAPTEEEEERVGCVTTDFAMQNTMLQMGLKILTVDGRRAISKIRHFALRCSACGLVTRELGKKFCDACGSFAMHRVAFKVGRNGVARAFVNPKKRLNIRGTKYPIPKTRGGRHNNDLILRADQIDPRKQRHIEKRLERQNVDVLDPTTFYNAGARFNPNEKPLVIGYGRRNPNEVRKTAKKR